VLSGTERKYERARQFHVRHLFLDLEVDFEQKAVSGVAVLDVERVAPDADRLSLDAIGFELVSVRLQERQGEDAADGDRDYTDAEYEYDGETLRIAGLSAHERARLEIRYRAEPRRGLYFLEPDAKVKDRPVQVWSQCQDEDARHWFPCHDKPHVKMTTELRVRVPAGFVALSNGDPVGEEVTPSAASAPAIRKKAAGKARGKVPARKARASKGRGRGDSAFEYFHFKLDRPHPSYLVTLVIGKFAIVEDRDAQLPNNRRIPVRYYVPESRRDDALRSFGETPRMLELFSKLTGTPYPFSRYTQVVVSDFIFGGMENTTATTMYEHALLDKRAALDISSTDIVAHELAHQWFGDFVTCRDWSQAWLNEGFATYLEHVERADRLGRDEYDYSIQGDLETYLGEAASRYQRPIVCRDYQEPIDLFDRHLYEKGGLVLHMLRRRLGDELFWRGVRLYLSGHAHGIVETNDLQRAFEGVSGDSLDEFFDQWVYRPGHPELKVKIGYEDGFLTASVKQTQKTGEVATFAFDFEIEVREKGGKVTRHRKRVSSTQDALVLPLAARPEYVAFDPELRVLGAITFEAPNDMLRRQLEHGSSAVLRWTAAEALGKKSDPATISALARALEDEKETWMVRAEAARALGKTRAERALEVLIAQARTEHPKVRRAVVSGLGVFRDGRAVAAVRPLASKDPSYVVESEAARTLGKTREKAALAPILSMIDRASWGDVIRIGVFDGLSALRDDSALDQVLAHTQYGFPTRGRRSAISALAQLGEGRRTREALELLLDDRDPHVRLEVISALLTLGDVKCRPALRRALERELDGRVARRIREALRDLGDTNTERKRLADDLETLRGELAELKARFSKLEVKHGAKHGEESRAGTPARKKKGKKRG
jgi:aminopeptidase N